MTFVQNQNKFTMIIAGIMLVQCIYIVTASTQFFHAVLLFIVCTVLMVGSLIMRLNAKKATIPQESIASVYLIIAIIVCILEFIQIIIFKIYQKKYGDDDEDAFAYFDDLIQINKNSEKHIKDVYEES